MAVQEVVDHLCDRIDAEACNVGVWSQEGSIEIYQGIISHCKTWIVAIQSDLES